MGGEGPSAEPSEAEVERARAEARAAQERLAALEGRAGPGAASAPDGGAAADAEATGATDPLGSAPTAESGPGETGSSTRVGLGALAVVGAVLVLALWRAGTFDYALVDWGLNAKDCARNDFGAVYCGDELARQQSRALEENARRYELEAKEFERQSKAWRACGRSVGYEDSEAVCGPAPEPPALGGP